MTLEKLESAMRDCHRCPLRDGAAQVVVGCGSTDSGVVFVGEAPGADEDKFGQPFVGRSGKLLNQLMAESGIARERVFITNTVKCRPPENRTPSRAETDACRLWLDAQLEALNPGLIVTIGNISTQMILATKNGITTLRGHFHQSTISGRTVLVRPLLHPSYLLRNRSRTSDSPIGLTLSDLHEIYLWMKQNSAG